MADKREPQDHAETLEQRLICFFTGHAPSRKSRKGQRISGTCRWSHPSMDASLDEGHAQPTRAERESSSSETDEDASGGSA